jgi:hypothetical protein
MPACLHWQELEITSVMPLIWLSKVIQMTSLSILHVLIIMKSKEFTKDSHPPDINYNLCRQYLHWQELEIILMIHTTDLSINTYSNKDACKLIHVVVNHFYLPPLIQRLSIFFNQRSTNHAYKFLWISFITNLTDIRLPFILISWTSLCTLGNSLLHQLEFFKSCEMPIW